MQRARLLLTGLLFCGECGKKFTSQHYHSTKYRKDGSPQVYEAEKYRCSSYLQPIERTEKCHQRLYRSEELDGLVVRDAKEFVTLSDRTKLIEEFKTDVEAKTKQAEVRLDRAEAELNKNNRETQKLKDEIMKALLGESAFSQDVLSGMLKTKEAEGTELRQRLSGAQQEIMALDQELSMRTAVCEEMTTFAERFDKASTPEKKAMLISIIDRINVHADRFEIDYKLRFDINPFEGLVPIDTDSVTTDDCPDDGNCGSGIVSESLTADAALDPLNGGLTAYLETLTNTNKQRKSRHKQGQNHPKRGQVTHKRRQITPKLLPDHPALRNFRL